MVYGIPREVLTDTKPTEADKINRIGQLRQGVVKVIENQNSLMLQKKVYSSRYDYWLWRCRSSS
jgi:hypothetical protein